MIDEDDDFFRVLGCWGRERAFS